MLLTSPMIRAARLTRRPRGSPGATSVSASASRGVAAPPGGERERARKRVVALVLVIYLLAIFEGALRKYAFPQFGQYIFFIRDPFLVYTYVLATRFGFWPQGNKYFAISVFMCAFGVVLFAVQYAVGGFSEHRVLLGIYGWRSYFLYVPLAFLVGAQFRAADLMRFARITLLLSVPIAVLVSLQFVSLPDAPINVGIAGEAELQFKGMHLSGFHIRPAGPFTSNAGQQQFVTTAWAILLAFLIVPKAQRKLGLVPLLVAAGAILTCVALGGSRGTLLQCMLIGLFAVSIGFVGRGLALKAKAIAFPALLAAAAVALYPIVFPDGFAAFAARWNAAEAAESRDFQGGVLGRGLFGFIDFFRLVEVAPALGYGLGFGGNASITLGAMVDGVLPGKLVETDFARHMVDLGPALGVCFIVYRVALAVWLGRTVLAATRRVADPLPMMLFSYAFYVLLLGQITGNGSINVYGWLFTGLCIAATREALLTSRVRHGSVDASAPAPTRRREPHRQPSRRQLPPSANAHRPPPLGR